MTMTSPLRGPTAHKEAASPPLIPRCAAHATEPPLRPQGCCASRWRATALRAALDPGDHCGPWGPEQRAGPGLPPLSARRPPLAVRSDNQETDNDRYHSQTLETVKHHLKPNRQRSVGPRHAIVTAAARHPHGPGSCPPSGDARHSSAN